VDRLPRFAWPRRCNTAGRPVSPDFTADNTYCTPRPVTGPAEGSRPTDGIGISRVLRQTCFPRKMLSKGSCHPDLFLHPSAAQTARKDPQPGADRKKPVFLPKNVRDSRTVTPSQKTQGSDPPMSKLAGVSVMRFSFLPPKSLLGKIHGLFANGHAIQKMQGITPPCKTCQEMCDGPLRSCRQLF